MNTIVRIPLRLIVFVGVGLLAACGGGGGGGGSSSSLSYTGSTSPAAITSSNGQSLAVSSFQNGATGASAVAVQSDQPPMPPPTLVIADTVQKFTLQRLSAQAPTGAASSYSGSCGGNATVNGDNTSVSITFNDYCDSGITMAGTITASFPAYTTGTTSLTLTITMNMLIRDNTSGLVYKVDNYSMTDDLTLDGASSPTVLAQDLSLNGTFYDPVNGYVVVETLTPFHLNQGAIYPTAGVLIVSAGAMPAPNAKLTANADGTTYTIDYDLNGDGNYGDSPQVSGSW